jgi:hypothetical protein
MTEPNSSPSDPPIRWSLARAVMVVFAGFALLFGVYFAMIRGPHISDTRYVLFVMGMAAFLTAASFGGYWLMKKCIDINHRRRRP